ncbi:DUF742 domain-containing protein [Streptomyces sp. NPDC048172]|uniref:DUF742 domain-containing protein n=1 Tax=Streptomyces sp. NPDC048172 TaxID=3365505 RepID=UPI00372355A5
MSDPEQEKGRSWREEGGPERLYLLADEKKKPDEHVPLDVVSLILSRGEPSASLQPEQASIVQICEYPLSVAELSAYLKLPVSVVMVILTELLTGGHVEARAPATQSKSLPDIQLLEAVMHGLQNL